MKITKYTAIGSSKSGRGHTVYSSVTFEDGSKGRLIKRTKEEELDDTKRLWDEMLKKGLNPTDKDDERLYHKLSGKHTIKESLQDFYKSSIVTPDTLTSYKSKLRLIEDWYGNKFVNEVKAHDVEKILRKKVKDGEFAQTTLSHAKKVFTAFFTWCVDEGILETTPLNFKKSLKSDKDTNESHVPFSEDHFKLIINTLKEDKNRLYFNYCNFIYHIHLRPKEVRMLKKGDIDLEKNVITIKSSVAKNDKKDILPIFPALRKIIDSMSIDELQDDDFIFYKEYSNGRRTQLSKSYVSDRFRPILKSLNIYDNTGYDLYSFKAKGNLDKLDKLGWSLIQLQKCNRHATVAQTLTYLKNIGKVTDIDNLDSIEL